MVEVDGAVIYAVEIKRMGDAIFFLLKTTMGSEIVILVTPS
jgi:hypothetical protein